MSSLTASPRCALRRSLPKVAEWLRVTHDNAPDIQAASTCDDPKHSDEADSIGSLLEPFVNREVRSMTQSCQ